MAVLDRIRATTGSTSSPFTLSATAPTGFRPFSAFTVGDANIPVVIAQQDGLKWQTCYCTYSAANQLTVNTVVASTNNNLAETFSGTSDVFVSPIANAVAMLRETNTFTNSTGQIFRQAATQDGVLLRGRAGGTTSLNVEIVPGTLTASRTLTAPDRTGTIITSGDTNTVTNGMLANSTISGVALGSNLNTLTLGTGLGGTSYNGSGAVTATVSYGTSSTTACVGNDARLSDTRIFTANQTYAFAAGTQALPSITTNGDLDTGGWFPAANTFAISTNALERLRIDSLGNVSIGTTSTSFRLDVSGASRIGNLVTQAAPSTTDILSTAHVILGGAGANYLTVGQYPSGVVGQQFGTWMQASFQNPTTATYNLFLQPLGGNVGIGSVTNPGYRLHVVGTGYFTDTVRFGASAHGNIGSDASSLYVRGDNISFQNAAATTNYVYINSSGNVGIGLTSLAANTRLHIRNDTEPTNETRAIVQSVDQRIVLGARWVSGVEQYSYIASTSDTGAATDFRIRTGSTDRLTVLSSGNLGVGVTVPTFRFVAGNSSTDAGWLYSSGSESYLGLGGFSGAGDGAFRLTYDRSNGNITLSGGLRDTPTPRMRIDNSGNVGVGTTSPSCRFHVRHDATGGSPATSGTTDTGMIHRINNNVVGLDTGVLTSGNTWIQNRNTTNFSFNYPILLNPNGGGVAIGTVTPTGGAQLTVSGSADVLGNIQSLNLLLQGNNADGFVRPTNAGSNLYLGAANANRVQISASGGMSVGGNLSDPGFGALRIGRQNSASEGGQIEFCRASDDTVGWYIDSFGSSTGSDPGALRFVDARAPATRLEFTGRGVLAISNDLGPGSGDTQAVGFRGSPNNDLAGAYTLSLTDAGRTVRKTSTTLRTVTIPADSTVNFPLGTCIMLCNVVDGTSNSTTVGNLTVACAASGPTLVWLSGTTKNNRTSATNTQIAGGGSATLRKVAANLWTITGAGIA